MNGQLRQALAAAAGVDSDSPSTAIGDALLLPEQTRNEPAPGFKIDAHPGDETGKMLRLWQGPDFVISSRDRAWLVARSWHVFRRTDDRQWVLA